MATKIFGVNWSIANNYLLYSSCFVSFFGHFWRILLNFGVNQFSLMFSTAPTIILAILLAIQKGNIFFFVANKIANIISPCRQANCTHFHIEWTAVIIWFAWTSCWRSRRKKLECATNSLQNTVKKRAAAASATDDDGFSELMDKIRRLEQENSARDECDISGELVGAEEHLSLVSSWWQRMKFRTSCLNIGWRRSVKWAPLRSRMSKKKLVCQTIFLTDYNMSMQKNM